MVPCKYLVCIDGFEPGMLYWFGLHSFHRWGGEELDSCPLLVCDICQDRVNREIKGGPAGDVVGTSADSAMGTSVDSAKLASSEEHYKDNNNSLKILAVMCHGLNNEDDSDLINFNKDPWKSLKVTTYRPSLVE